MICVIFLSFVFHLLLHLGRDLQRGLLFLLHVERDICIKSLKVKANEFHSYSPTLFSLFCRLCNTSDKSLPLQVTSVEAFSLFQEQVTCVAVESHFAMDVLFIAAFFISLRFLQYFGSLIVTQPFFLPGFLCHSTIYVT